MSHCDFCQIEDEYLKQICCSQGLVSCAECLMSGNVNSATLCSQCNQQLGKKMGVLRAEIRQLYPSYCEANMKYRGHKQDYNMGSHKKMLNNGNGHEYY
jgi:hypothetical protein